VGNQVCKRQIDDVNPLFGERVYDYHVVMNQQSMDLVDRRFRVEAAREALSGLGSVLHEASGAELAELMTVVDGVTAGAAARVAITVEAVNRGEVAAAGSNAHAWVRDHRGGDSVSTTEDVTTNPTRNAIRLGLKRGLTEFSQSMRSTQDQGFYLFMAALTAGYLFLRRDTPVEGTDLLLPSVALPSILGALIAFGVVIGPAYALAMEKEDGTLLRHKAVPHGLQGYFTGQLLFQSLSLLPQMVVILVPSFLLFDDLMAEPSGWVTVAWVLVLGLLATMPIGMVIGALVPSTQKVGTLGMVPVLVLAGISGIFYPVQMLLGWVQVVAQIFPMYWIALGMRSAFLPDEAAALEIGGSWRTTETVVVLGIWAVVGSLLTPMVLRRMARRQTGSQVEAARDASLQWVR
jgi:ABC-2 type transport system permease protein